MKNPFLIFVLIISLLFTHYSYGAVTSQGEINVAGQTKGIVPASSTVPLIVTLQIDRSLAEIGEEIKTIEIIMPNGFVPQVSDFDSILRDKETLKAKAIISGNALRIELARTIVDTQNSRYEIAFDCRTSNNFFEAVFRVLLRNNDDVPIGEYIEEGQADGKLNNDDFTLQVIPNVPPAPVSGFTAEADKTGENDVTLRWQKSTDPDVNGYLIYRDKDFQINVENRASTTFRDVDVLPGNHTYEITAYKTLFLQSGRSPTQTVEVSEDTAAPEPPNMLRVVTSSEGIEVSWKPSVTRDTTRYQILFGSSEIDTLEPLPDGEISTDGTSHESSDFKFVDRRPLSVGSYIYAVVAIDEVDNESAPVKVRFRIFDKPYPNPFTPLSDDPDFNTLIFPARAVEDVEGEFSVLLFNLNGVLVKTLTAQLGETELKWDGKNESGETVESGIYIYQLQVGNSIKTGTIIVVK